MSFPEIVYISSSSELSTDELSSSSVSEDSDSENEVTIIGEVIRSDRPAHSNSSTVSRASSARNDDSSVSNVREAQLGQPAVKRYKRIVPPTDSNSNASSDSDSYRYLGRQRRRKSSAASESESSDSESNRTYCGGSPSCSNSSRASNTQASDSGTSEEEPIGTRTRSRFRLKSESPKSKPKIEFSSGDEDEGSDKSCTSEESSERELKGKCVVCRNIEKINIRGRSTTRNTSWCTCGNCRHFGYTSNDFDLICCREYKDAVRFFKTEVALKKNPCITSHPRFRLDVVKIRALKRTRRKPPPRTRQARIIPSYDTATKSYVRWIWDRTLSGTKMLIPACVRAELINRYDYRPAPRVRLGAYDCSNGRRCKVA